MELYKLYTYTLTFRIKESRNLGNILVYKDTNILLMFYWLFRIKDFRIYNLMITSVNMINYSFAQLFDIKTW